MFWFWWLTVPALALALLSLTNERRRARYYAACLAARAPDSVLPPATLIVPVKGPEEGLRENLAALASQDYPDYELMIVARTAGDIPEGVVPPGARVILAGDGPSHTGEKVHNLLTAVQYARPGSEVFAFADSDGRPGGAWLRALAAALRHERAGASTGYRWHLPDPPDFWSLMRGAWDAVIAGRLGPGSNDFAWGGAVAIRREIFFGCGVPRFWRGAVSDDFRLSDAVRSAGLEIRFAPGALVPSTDHIAARAFLSWIRRQMLLTRVCRPRLWWAAFVSHVLYCAAAAACIVQASRGDLLGEYVLVALLGLGMLKGANRAALAKAALPDYGAWFKRHGWIYAWWTPVATWVWMYALAASALGSTIEWRGKRYRLSRLEDPRDAS